MVMTVLAIRQALEIARNKGLLYRFLNRMVLFWWRGKWPRFKRDVVTHHYLLNLRPFANMAANFV